MRHERTTTTSLDGDLPRSARPFRAWHCLIPVLSRIASLKGRSACPLDEPDR
jgi:hypothetical protein